MFFVLLLILACFFILLSVYAELVGHYYWNVVGIFVAIGIFLILSVGGMEIESGYQLFNATSGNIETGYQTYFYIPELSYFWIGMAAVCIIYFLTLIFEPFMKMLDNMKRWR